MRLLLIIAGLCCAAAAAVAEERPAKVLFLIGEDEYQTEKTLPAFAKEHLSEPKFHCEFVFAADDRTRGFPGIEKLENADLLVLSVRRRTLPKDQRAVLKHYLAAGKPLVAIRTASHAFALREGDPPAGHEVWPEFDREVLGCHYHNHHGNKGGSDPRTFVWVEPKAASHAALRGVEWKPGEEARVTSWLYKSEPLAKSCELLMWGRVEGREPKEPVTWVNTGNNRRVFYTSLGHPDDFSMKPFQQLLVSGIDWALGEAK
jgi:hypothetical protein